MENKDDFIITDEPKEDMEKDVEEQFKNDIFYSLVMGKQIEKKIETERGEFTVKFPKEKDRALIALLAAKRRGGIAVESFTQPDNNRIEILATLDVVVVDGPDWYKAAKKKNKNFSWGDMPDTNFVDSIFVEAWTFFQTVQSKFGKHTENEDRKPVDAQDDSETVGGGLFSGVAATSKRD